MRIPLPQVGLSTNTTATVGAGPAPQVSGDVLGKQMQGLGQAALQAGTAAMGIASELRLEHDTAATKEAYTQLADYSTEILENPRDGYFTKEGKAAVGYERAKALGSIEKRWREIEEGLGTSVSKGMFRDAARRHLEGAKNKVYGHEATQRRVWSLGQTRAMGIQSQRDAIDSAIRGDTPIDVVDGAEIAGQEEDRAAGFQGPETSIGTSGKRVAPGAPQAPEGEQEPGSLRGKTYAQAQAEDRARREKTPTWQVHMNTAVDQAEEESQMKGESAELRRERVLQVRTTIHSGIVRGMLKQGRTKEARAWLEKTNPKHLAADARFELEGALLSSTQADRSFELANEIVDELSQPEPINIDLGDGVIADLTTWAGELQRSATPGGTGAGITSANEVDTTTMLARGAAKLRARFEAGEIDARTRDMTMARLKETHGILVNQWNGQAQETLLAAEQWFEGNTDVTDPDSPTFPQELRDRLIGFGSLDSARKIGAARGARKTDPVVYRQMLEDFESGAFDGMQQTQLFNRYYAHLGPVEWNEAQSFLAAANKVSTKAIPDDDFYGVNDQVLEQALLGEVITARSPEGRPKPTNAGEAERLVEYKAEVQRRWNVERAALGGKELPTAEKVRIAGEVSMQRAYVPDEELFSAIDPKVWMWQSGLSKTQKQEAYVETKFGTEVQIASIPSSARKMIQDTFRLSLVPRSQRSKIRSELVTHGAGTDSADRTAIESMWSRLGIVSRDADLGTVAEKWEQLRQVEGSRYYKWGEAK